MLRKLKIYVICKKYAIKNYTINRDGSIDVRGDVDLSNKSLKKLPLRFNYVSGNFNCCVNNLITLKGSPREVGGIFYCHFNSLKSLEFGPERVGGSFFCESNQISTLKYSPREVGGGFYFGTNPLPELMLQYIYIATCRDQPLAHLNCSVFSSGASVYFIKIIMSESEDFSIWRRDGSLDELRFKYMMTILKEEGKIT